MDLTLQCKLSKVEWNMLEIPVSDEEKKILQLIIDGYTDVSIRRNNTETMLSFIKNTSSEEMEKKLYKTYFDIPIKEIIKKYAKDRKSDTIRETVDIISRNIELSGGKIKRADSIRIDHMNENINSNKEKIFEFIQIEFAKKILKCVASKSKKYAFYLYTLIQTNKAQIPYKNRYVQQFITAVISHSLTVEENLFRYIIENSQEYIEKNKYIIQYSDLELYEHQRKLFALFHRNTIQPRLVLYLAPTGTGKTMSPLGLSQQYRIIFVCVARHVGLALAKSAISMNKKIAFAFGCESAADIRLHYFAAKEYTKNRRSGMIHKVDNSVGDLVEIMICDIKSYLCAMNYMLAFHPVDNIITYWDEPTITMDVENHELHPIIHRNWCENRIPNLILSCATLPHEEEIIDTIIDFRTKFPEAEVYTISSYETKKTVSLINNDGYTVTPHNLYENYEDVINCAEHCEKTKSLLKYFDLDEISRFIIYVNDNSLISRPRYYIPEYFGEICDITMSSIKMYYLELLKHIKTGVWGSVYLHMSRTRTRKIGNIDTLPKIKRMTSDITTPCAKFGDPIAKSYSVASYSNNSVGVGVGGGVSSAGGGIFITTSDAYTLTDGPTIYLAEDINKIARFYLQQSNIPEMLLMRISIAIENNNKIAKQIDKLQKTIEDATSKDSEKENKMSQEHRIPKPVLQLMTEIETLRNTIQPISLEKEYVPNSFAHMKKWVGSVVPEAFTSDIDDQTVEDIMNLQGVANSWKLLLLMGIGMFGGGGSSSSSASELSSEYMEIMKKLAYSQKLYMIIASSDFIYGTNYQFSHAFIAKDLIGLTQQKIIQSIGRVGRNNVQLNYTVRFRDNEMLERLFKSPSSNLEAENMSRLFNSDN